MMIFFNEAPHFKSNILLEVLVVDIVTEPKPITDTFAGIVIVSVVV